MTTENLIGKTFELLNIDGSIMERFKIGKVKQETTESVHHEDGSISPSRINVYVSEKGSGWHRLYYGNFERIL